VTTLIYEKEYLVFGCGNTLFGNDGFGPEVVAYLAANYSFPDSVLVLDAGTGIKDFVFDLLLVEKKPKLVIVIDAVTMEGRKTNWFGFNGWRRDLRYPGSIRHGRFRILSLSCGKKFGYRGCHVPIGQDVPHQRLRHVNHFTQTG